VSVYERQLDDCWVEISGLKDQLDAATERNGNLAVELASMRQSRNAADDECTRLSIVLAEMHDVLEAVYKRYQHLNWLRQKANLDPWHECVRDFLVAVAIALGYEQKAGKAGKEVNK
jgi:chromosome segregation ATPase